MHIVRAVRALVLGAVLVLTVLAHGTARVDAQATFQSTPTVFSGQATVVNGTVLGMPITLVDSGTVAAEGSTLEAHLLCYPNGTNCAFGLPDLTSDALHISVLNATAIAQGHESRAGTSVADLSLNAAGQSISATFVQARAAAQCTNGQASVRGDSEIADLVVNGDRVVVAGEINQRVDLPAGGVVLINEQTGSANADKGDVTVSAVHIRIPGPVAGTDTDVVIGQAHADIACGQQFCPVDKDFVTGGGWLSDPRRNFAVAGGMKNGGWWGHLLYIDHATGMKVKGTGVTAYQVTGNTTRRIEGTCEINGTPENTYQIDVDDQGEPGVGRDVFVLSLNKMPVASGVLSGGNIQLHTCKP